MSNSNKKIKIYVLGAMIVTLIISRLLFLAIDKNYKFTPSNFVRSFKAIQIKHEFNNFAQTADLPDPDYLKLNLDYATSIPILVYHGIVYDNTSDQISITVESFKDQMFALKKAGYNTITTEELYKYLKKEIVLPPKSVLITFDDGRIDSFEYSDPIFKALDYKATMFTIGRYTFLEERDKYYLSKKQLKQMSTNKRWDIQAHSYDGHESYFITPNIQEGHFFSHKQWISSNESLETDEEFRERISTDYKKVKEEIETLLKKPVHSFAFPYGDYGQNETNFKEAKNISIEEAEKFYSMIFYQVSPVQRFKNNYLIDKKTQDTFFSVKRIIVDSKWTGSDLLNELDISTTKVLPYTDDFTQNNGWLLLWGKIALNGGVLDLQTNREQSGGTIILDGSRLWKDYSIKASVTSPNKKAVYVWARFQDDNNNAACDFGNGFIHIEQTINGEKKVIRGITNKNIKIPSGEFEIKVDVKDREIECILDNEWSVKSTFLDPSLDMGGIGFKVWDRDTETARMLLKKLTVE